MSETLTHLKTAAELQRKAWKSDIEDNAARSDVELTQEEIDFGLFMESFRLAAVVEEIEQRDAEIDQQCKRVDWWMAECEKKDAEIAAWKERFDPDGVCGFDGTSIVMSG